MKSISCHFIQKTEQNKILCLSFYTLSDKMIELRETKLGGKHSPHIWFDKNEKLMGYISWFFRDLKDAFVKGCIKSTSEGWSESSLATLFDV